MPSVDLGKVTGNDGVGVPSGGSAGQVLRKQSSSNYDTEWYTIPNATTSAAGLMSSGDKTKLDSLTPTSEAATSYLPSNVWGEQYHTIQRFGKMVIVNISGKLNATPSAAVTLFNNLPPAKGTCAGNVAADNGFAGPITMAVNSTTIETRGPTWVNDIKTTYVRGQLVYFTT